MEGFKSLPKMQHFKEGGHAKAKNMCWGGKAMKKGGEAKHEDIAEDKKLIKKAFKQHDEAEHDKEPTEIKLRKGGRTKKEAGTVKKYKKGGEVTNVYEAKKGSGDLDNIEKVKKIKLTAAKAPSKASTKPAMKGSDVAKEKSKPAGTSKAKEVADRPKVADSKSGAKGGPNNYKTGGKVKKFDNGGSTGYLTPDQQRTLKAVKTGNYRSSDDDNMNYAQPAPSSSGVKLPSLGPANNFPSLEDYQKAGSPAPKKKGGAIKKYADGSSVIRTPEQKRIAAERAHQMNLLANINKLRDPSQQAQLMAQQQAIGGNNSLNQIANQMNPPGQQMGTPAAAPAAPVGQPQPTNMGAMQAPGGVSPAGPIPGQKRGGRAGAC
jgi:hypothetical protein